MAKQSPLTIDILPNVGHVERLLFTKHMSVMVKAGIPILEAIDTLQTQTKSATFRRVLKSVYADVRNGQSLANALGKYPRVFNEFYVSMVRVGEESGTLEQSLEFLSRQLTKEHALRNKVRGAMLYPALLLTAVVVMGTFISLFVLPQLVKFFEAFNVTLPVTTRILLFVANIMKDYGVFIFAALFFGIGALIAFMNTPPVRPVWHAMILKIPVFGDFLVNVNLANITRNLGVLMGSGVPVNRSLEVTAMTTDNLKFRNDILEISQKLEKGKNISSVLEEKKYTEFPSIVGKMIAVGEKTGKLEEVLLYLSDYYEDEIENFTKNLSTILEPFLLIGIGLIVGFMALAIISPIYELTGSIGK